MYKKYKGILRKLPTLVDNCLIFANKTPSKTPLFISWNITYKCNVKCSFCNVWRKEKKGELDTEECTDIIRQASKGGTMLINLTGGEPLIRDDIGLILEEIKKCKMKANINTNGFLLAEKSDLLGSVNAITISVDGHTPDIHNGIRDKKGLFDNIEKGIEAVKRQKKPPLIMLRCVISRKNFKYLDYFMDYWSHKADSISFQPIHSGIETSIHDLSDKSFSFVRRDRWKFKKHFKIIQEKYPFLRSKYYNYFEDFIFDKKSLLKYYNCYQGFLNMKIDAFGKVYSCGALAYELGDLRKDRLLDIWKGKKYEHFRKIQRKYCNEVCWRNDVLLNVYLSKLPKLMKNQFNWNEYYNHYGTSFIEKINRNYFSLIFLKEFKKIVKRNNLNILEAGCGSGYMSSLLSKNNEITVLDISEKALEIAKQNIKNGTFVKGDIFNLPFEDNSFDVVWNQGVLEHFPPIDAIKEMLRVTNNYLIIFLPAFMSPLQISGLYKIVYDKNQKFYKIKEFKELMKKAGCKEIYSKRLFKSFGFSSVYFLNKNE